jgi:hypothetical protein
MTLSRMTCHINSAHQEIQNHYVPSQTSQLPPASPHVPGKDVIVDRDNDEQQLPTLTGSHTQYHPILNGELS